MIRLAVATILVANLLAVVLAWLARCPDLCAHEPHDWYSLWEREWAEIDRRMAE